MDRLDGQIQHYRWGDLNTIAELQQRHPSGVPEAELWLGAHHALPSTLRHQGLSLDRVIERDPGGSLGSEVESEFGTIPFLLKILAAAEPLSIQVHPNKAQAEQGFSRQQFEGLAIDAPTRIFRDPNHKPELICALARFEAKCGFRKVEQSQSIVGLLEASANQHARSDRSVVAQFKSKLNLESDDEATVLARCLQWIYALDHRECSHLVAELAAGARQLVKHWPASTHIDSADDECQMVVEWTVRLADSYPGDPGVAVALLLNHVVLHPGEAMFLGAGVPHSYLGGAGIEIMANSDNVVRGGLTSKHVDTSELARMVNTQPHKPVIQSARRGHHRFDTPCSDFDLSRISGMTSHIVDPAGPEIVLVTEGVAHISTANSQESRQQITLSRGEAAFVAYNDGPYRLSTTNDTVAWRASAGYQTAG